MNFYRHSLHVALFLAGLFATSICFQARTPFYLGEFLGPKTAHVRTATDPYDIVFFGSSTVARGIDPHVLDSTLGEIYPDRTLRSFNAALPGVSTLQINRAMRQALSGEFQPAFVMVELAPFWPDIKPINYRSRRLISVSDLDQTYMAIIALWAIDRDWDERLILIGQRIDHLALNFFRVGGYQEVWASFGDEPLWKEQVIARQLEHSGFESFTRTQEIESKQPSADQYVKRAAKFRADSTWNERIARWDTRTRWARNNRANAGLCAAALVIRQKALEALGVTPIFLVMPQNKPTPLFIEEAEAAGLRHVIDLNNPIRFPDLFKKANRFDTFHLNAMGAAIAARILAKELAPILKDHHR